jgi:hypothetical protein
MAQKRKRSDESSITESIVRFHHYPTPSQLVRHAIRYFCNGIGSSAFDPQAQYDGPPRIIDHSCGTGVWNAVGAELIPDSYRVNVEYQVALPVRYETAHEWHMGMRFQDYVKEFLMEQEESPAIHPLFDIAWGNFPFKEGEEFIHESGKILRDGGFAFNLAPINFLSTQARIKSLYRVWCPIRVIHIPKRISFTKNGKTDEKEYILIVHRKGENPRYAQEDWWFDWDYDQPDIPEDAPFESHGAPEPQVALWT